MVDWIRTGTNLPGPIGRQHYYWAHASGLCVMGVWRRPTTTTNAPVAVFVHGEGFGCQPGWGSMTDLGALAPGYQRNLAQALYDRGYVIVTIDYPACSRNILRESTDEVRNAWRIYGSWRERHPLSFWPEQPMFVGLAIQHIKTNWSGVSGITETVYGPALWGAGSSIDPNKVVVVADKHGGTMSMYTFWQPTGYLPFERELAHESFDPYTPRASHRIAALIARNPGPIDFTQFWVEPSNVAGSGVPEELAADRYCIMMRCESQRRWGSGDYSSMPEPEGGQVQAGHMYHVISPQWKRASPWWVLQENHTENANLPMYVQWEEEGYGANDTALGPNDWSPGTQRDDKANQKAWQKPYDGRIQGSALRTALSSYGGVAGTGLPIRSSVVRDPASTAFAPLSSDAYAPAVVAWLGTLNRGL